MSGDKAYKKQKVNVILDTNIWLYLSNGSEQLTHDVSKKNLHFELLRELKEKQEAEEFTILVTEINIIEWERNKHHAQSLIKRQKNRIEDLLNKLKIYKKRNVAEDNENEQKKIDKDIAVIEADVEKNRLHIISVENFLKKECQIIPTSNDLKLRIWEMAINKAIPLHTDKNNIADTSILLSTIEYISSEENQNHATVFISNNSKDFCIDKDSNEFHPELKKLIGYLDLRFERKLDTGLEISKEIQIELDEFFEEKFYDNIYFSCKSKYCYGNDYFTPFGYLTKSARILSKFESAIDLNQLSLFPEDKVRKKPQIVAMGSCSYCGSKHIECPVCDELIADVEIGDDFLCGECNANLQVIYSWHDGELDIILKESDEDK